MYKIDNDTMLKFFQSNQEVKYFSDCCNIIFSDETNIEFYTSEENKPNPEYIEFYECSNVLKVYINTKSDNLIIKACEKISKIYSLYEGVEICLPEVDITIIGIVRNYFNISNDCDCEWGNYALLSNEKLQTLNIPGNTEISFASCEQIEYIKGLSNEEWEWLPERCIAHIYDIHQSRLLILLYQDDVLAGYIEAVCRYKNYYNICNVFVHETFRGNSFGSLLTIYYANCCLDNGFIPHYGAAMSKHSESVAIKSGFEQTSRYHFFQIRK